VIYTSLSDVIRQHLLRNPADQCLGELIMLLPPHVTRVSSPMHLGQKANQSFYHSLSQLLLSTSHASHQGSVNIRKHRVSGCPMCSVSYLAFDRSFSHRGLGPLRLHLVFSWQIIFPIHVG